MEGKDSLSQEEALQRRQDDIDAVENLLEDLKERYGERLKIKTADPRYVLTWWDDIRFGVRPATPAWILNGKKLCDGVPSLAVLQDAIGIEEKGLKLE
jgi:hypothetical protein